MSGERSQAPGTAAAGEAQSDGLAGQAVSGNGGQPA